MALSSPWRFGFLSTIGFKSKKGVAKHVLLAAILSLVVRKLQTSLTDANLAEQRVERLLYVVVTVCCRHLEEHATKLASGRLAFLCLDCRKITICTVENNNNDDDDDDDTNNNNYNRNNNINNKESRETFKWTA